MRDGDDAIDGPGNAGGSPRAGSSPGLRDVSAEVAVLSSRGDHEDLPPSSRRGLAVREVLERWKEGQPLRAIARETGLDRKTVRRYVELARTMRRERWMPVDDDVVHAIEAVIGAAAVRESGALRDLGVHRGRIRRYLGARMTLVAVHAALGARGVKVSYATLRRFVIAELGWQTRAARRDAA